MKGISTIISVILLVVIIITLAGSAYLFFSGMLTGKISKVISIVSAEANYIIVRNDGTDIVVSDDVKITVNGEQVDTINPQDIEPQKSVVLKFIPINFGSELRSAKISLVGPSNSLGYTTDFVPHESEITADTVGLWYFNSVNTTDHTLDESQYRNDGWFNSSGDDVSLKIVNGLFESNALEFDGTDDYINCSDDSSLDITNEITVELWIYPHVISGWQSLLHKWIDTSNHNSLYLELNSNGDIVNYNTIQTTDNPITANNWFHVVYTADTSKERIYINGELKVEEDSQFQGMDNDYDLLIGSATYTQERFDGLIDEVVIYNKALTQEQILDNIYG